MFDYAQYARELRHELHRVPEIGYDLPKTTAIVRRELDAMGVSYTEKYGKGSVVAVINDNKPFTIGLRADMDALPIQEAGHNPFPSQHPGQMHACGHDAHTAQMLAVTRQLNDLKDSLRCRVKILFQPAEEYITPGGKMMVENGVMEDVDCAVACHVAGSMDSGHIGICDGGTNANSMGIVCEFFGKSAHAHSQQKGVDAIRMAVQAYLGMELMAAREIPSKDCFVFNVGSFHAGNTNNIVCDYAKMFLSARAWDDDLIHFMERRIRQICEATAKMCGGEAKVTVTKLIPYVKNHPVMVKKLRESAEKTLGKDHVHSISRSLGAEDFSFMTRQKPSIMFRFGTGNDALPESRCTVHNDHFDLDESAFDYGIQVFVNFILDNQDGIEF